MKMTLITMMRLSHTMIHIKMGAMTPRMILQATLLKNSIEGAEVLEGVLLEARDLIAQTEGEAHDFANGLVFRNRPIEAACLTKAG